MTSSTSVIIASYNEERTISACLESLSQQTVLPKEIIVVDDGSIDNTVKIVRQCIKGSLTHQLINASTHSGAGAARNLGAKKASGDILVFVDADMRFASDFLAILTEPICSKSAKGTFWRNEFVSNWNNWCARFWNYRRGQFVPRTIPASYPKVSPVFRAIAREEFQRVDGYSQDRGYNDDWTLSEKLGYKAKSTPAVVYHENPDDLSSVFTQSMWSAQRTYRMGLLGAIAALLRAFPLIATPLFVYVLSQKRKTINESTLPLFIGGILFSLVAQIGETIGILKFMLMRKVQK